MSTTRPELKLRQLQHDILDFIEPRLRCAVWAGVGSGKTTTILTLADALRVVDPSRLPMLVVAPRLVARDVWTQAAAKWVNFDDLIVVECSTPEEKGEPTRAEKLAAGWARRAHVYTTTYDVFPKFVDDVRAMRIGWPFKTVVLDESTRAKNVRPHGVRGCGVRIKPLRELDRLGHIKSIIELTGTPDTKDLQNLWGQMYWIDHGKRLGANYGDFEAEFYDVHPYKKTRKLKPGAEADIIRRVSDLAITINLRDYFDIPEVLPNVIECTLPPQARKHYAELERQYFTRLIAGEAVEAVNGGALAMKLRQVAQGAVYAYEPDDEGYTIMHDVKMQALDSIVEDMAGKPLLVAVAFIHDRRRILAAYPDTARYLSIAKNLAAFKRGEVPIGVAHPKSLGHGIDEMQDVCHDLVFFGHDWSLEDRLQIIGRVGNERQFQSNTGAWLTLHDIVMRDTIDVDILARHTSRASIQETLMAAARKWREKQ